MTDIPRSDEDIVDLAARLAALGVERFSDGSLHLTFRAPATEVPAVRDPASRLSPSPEDARGRAKTLREAAERQGIGPLKFPGSGI